MVYNFFFGNKQTQTTPQTQPIPGRESVMIQGKSGGYMFEAGIWRTLRRCLLIGTGNGSYYATKWELTNDFVDVLERAIAENPDRVAQEIVYAADGRSINNSAPIWALVILSMGESPAAKNAFRSIFPQVVRTASHFYEWMSYTKSVRGFGKVVREAGKNWLLQGDTKALAYQLLKYQQRHGFSNRDALRLFHAKPQTEDRDLLFKWVVNGWDELPPASPTAALNQIWWYEWLKRNPDRTPEAISKGRLTHEMAAPVGKMDVDAWQLLFEDMPIGALLRNRGFSTEFISLKINRSDSFSSAMKKASNLNFGGTDASSAYNWMIKNKYYADVICFWTDCESWAGYRHPSQALAEYRQKVNPDAKAIYISLVPNNISLVDPKDPNSWDIAGFDPSTPRLIQSIASGEL